MANNNTDQGQGAQTTITQIREDAASKGTSLTKGEAQNIKDAALSAASKQTKK